MVQNKAPIYFFFNLSLFSHLFSKDLWICVYLRLKNPQNILYCGNYQYREWHTVTTSPWHASTPYFLKYSLLGTDQAHVSGNRSDGSYDFLHGSCTHWTLGAKTFLGHLPCLPTSRCFRCFYPGISITLVTYSTFFKCSDSQGQNQLWCLERPMPLHIWQDLPLVTLWSSQVQYIEQEREYSFPTWMSWKVWWKENVLIGRLLITEQLLQ